MGTSWDTSDPPGIRIVHSGLSLQVIASSLGRLVDDGLPPINSVMLAADQAGGRPADGRTRHDIAVPRALVALCLVLTGTAAHAQGYPNKPITVVVPFGPGSGSDLIARIIGQRLCRGARPERDRGEQARRQRRDRGRAGRALGAGRLHDLLFASNTPMSAAPSLNKSIAYDPIKDFQPLCRIGSFTQLLLVNPGIPVKTVSELIAYAKANPGKLSFASANASSIVAGETLKRAAGLDLLHVPYRSSPPAVQDVLGGRVSMLFTDMATGLPHHKSGALRGLGDDAVANAARWCRTCRRSTRRA